MKRKVIIASRILLIVTVILFLFVTYQGASRAVTLLNALAIILSLCLVVWGEFDSGD